MFLKMQLHILYIDGIKLQLLTVENYFLPWPVFPFSISLFHFSILLPVFSRIDIHINYEQLNPCFRVCFYGNTGQGSFSGCCWPSVQIFLDYFCWFSVPFWFYCMLLFLCVHLFFSGDFPWAAKHPFLEVS